MRTDAEIEVLVRAFEGCTLPKVRWTHREHLTVALWYLRHHPRGEATSRIREGIRRFNLSHGNTTGYHETITLAWIALISRFLGEHDQGEALPLLVGALLEKCGDKGYLLRFYSEDGIGCRPTWGRSKADLVWVGGEESIMWGDRRLGWLVTAHVVLWLLSAPLAPVKVHTPFGLQHILIVPLVVFTFSQVTLLGIWAVLSPWWSWYRLLGLVIGTVCLEAALDIALGQEFVLMPTVAMALTVVSLLVVRPFGIRLSRLPDDVPSSRQEPQGFRFSIRGLMILTAVVAVLSATARGVQGSPGHFRLVLSVIWSVCFVAVSLLTIWGECGLGGSLRRSLPAVAVSPVLGAFFAYAADAHHDGWVYIITIMLLYPTVLVGSLLFVRSCGYHLVRRLAPRTSPSEFTVGDPGNAGQEFPTSRSTRGEYR